MAEAFLGALFLLSWVWQGLFEDNMEGQLRWYESRSGRAVASGRERSPH